MKCLLVIAHPVSGSLNASLAQAAAEEVRQCGHELRVRNLYDSRFQPALTQAERESYYGAFDASGIKAETDELLWADTVILVFPTWWFGMPAILKGWFDRVWAPGIAYDHAGDLGAIRARLHGLRQALAITTLGSPWWVDRFVLRQPVKRVLKTALLGTCAPGCRFGMLSLYGAERLAPQRVDAFRARIGRALAAWA